MRLGLRNCRRAIGLEKDKALDEVKAVQEAATLAATAAATQRVWIRNLAAGVADAARAGVNALVTGLGCASGFGQEGG